MTIDEAITDLSIQLEVKVRLRKIYEARAIRLGIEALRHYKQERERRGATLTMWLPGETED